MMSLNVGQRLQIMAATAMIALVVLAASGTYVASSLHGSMDYIYSNTLQSIQAIDSINEKFLKIRLNALYHFLQKDADKKAASEAQISKLKEQIREELVRYEKEFVSDPKDKELFEKEKGFFETYFVEIEPALERSRANDEEGIWSNVKKATAGMTKLSETITEHKKYNEQLAESHYKQATASASLGRSISLVLVVISLLVVGGISFVVVREIRSRMNRLSAFINNVSQTLDFTPRIKVTRLDELGSSGDAFNRLLDRLQDNLKSISHSTQSVAMAAHQLATTSEQVATTAYQQSEAASGMAATVEEITVSINHVADRAQEANRLSSESGQLAVSGEKIIGQTTSDIHDIEATVHDAAKLIHELEQQGQQIANVVQVIKEVADQTNLLALNAAIEAARAGEQGRGFAVVADEVRKLAERTSSSTQEISATIDAMKRSASNAVLGMEGVVDKVTQGVERSKKANTAIQQIGESSRATVEMVEEIASAIQEQGSATNSIAGHVERIAQMSEESSAAAENSSQAARNLDHLAADMLAIVSAYRLDGGAAER